MHRVADVEKSFSVPVSPRAHIFLWLKVAKEKWNCVFCWMQAQKCILSHEWSCCYALWMNYIFCVGVRLCVCVWVCVFFKIHSHLHPQRSTVHTHGNRWTKQHAHTRHQLNRCESLFSIVQSPSPRWKKNLISFIILYYYFVRVFLFFVFVSFGRCCFFPILIHPRPRKYMRPAPAHRTPLQWQRFVLNWKSCSDFYVSFGIKILIRVD